MKQKSNKKHPEGEKNKQTGRQKTGAQSNIKHSQSNLSANGAERALERTLPAHRAERNAWAPGQERNAWAHGAERTAWAPGAERALEQTLSAHGAERALERTRNPEYLRSARRLNHRQARWALFFTRFHFTVTYRPGSKNTKADSLSRQFESTLQPLSPDPILPTTLIVALVQWDVMTEIAETQGTDPIPTECAPNKTSVPPSLRTRVIQQVHDLPSFGHPEITASIQILSNKFWWSTLRTDIIALIKNCVTCNTSKSSKPMPAGLLQPLPAPQRPWFHIAIDFITDLPNSNSNTTILTVIDRFSKSCRLIPIPKLPIALETADVLCSYVFRLFGLPDDIVSNRGPQFTSRVWTAFFSFLWLSSGTSGYHPESNGKTERLNQEVTRFRRSYCHRNQADWSIYLFWAEYIQNLLHKTST